MKNVFALMGRSNRGKSQTIRTVVEMLTAKHPTATIEHNQTAKADVRAIVNINGLKIGVESQSAPKGLRDSLDLFVRTGCDAIICATRTRGATVDAVSALHGFEVHWLEQQEKSKPNEQILRSLITARGIVEQVEVLIESAEKPPVRRLSAHA